MIILSLNGTQIKGYGIKVDCEFSLPESDLSGKSSSTATAEEGEKACRLRVSLNIKYSDADDLKTIKLLSMDKDNDTGTRKIYNIDNQTAKAFAIRQVKFSDKLTARELDDAQAWLVSFVLIEHQSISEKVESLKIKENEPKAVPADEKVISEEASATTSQPTWIENVFAYLDEQLAGEDSATDEV
ncbi:hypothetical protein [Marinomonas aquiplantarum]|uniref:Uncharacterized protein n=1 Tax=Marinomonas aquiplantarum TaxID=491951 RepID=A0A366D1Y2_9GAMM|nr:hypothetical protein [Marinomonas aquiplantarum]RBO83444.1 hypothetical protein DFP76_104263 [Marinomonas aquiplantarum]